MPDPRRPRLLSFTVALVVIGNGAGLAKIVLGHRQLLAEYPALTPGVLGALALCPLVALVSAVLLWRGRRLGMWLAIADAVAVVAADIACGMPSVHIASVIALTGLVVFASIRAAAWFASRAASAQSRRSWTLQRDVEGRCATAGSRTATLPVVGCGLSGRSAGRRCASSARSSSSARRHWRADRRPGTA
ncbi:MAG: hypothetical protein IPM29_09715 [Planctomycetes bacterium]|nr:hypothetical protein [Planctomycetota bacterium]